MEKRTGSAYCENCDESWPVTFERDARGTGEFFLDDDAQRDCPTCGSEAKL